MAKNNENKTLLSNEDKTPNKQDQKFDVMIDKILKMEGGLSLNKYDKGGATKYGISLRFLTNEKIDINQDGVINEQDVIALTEQQAKDLYYQHFYLPMKIGEIKNQKLASNVFDMGINAGKVKAIKMLQEVSNKNGASLKVDGVMGTKTIEAVNQLDGEKLNQDFANERINYYEAICLNKPSQRVFLRGWTNRVKFYV